jgi:hypothetical protein
MTRRDDILTPWSDTLAPPITRHCTEPDPLRTSARQWHESPKLPLTAHWLRRRQRPGSLPLRGALAVGRPVT